MPFLFFAAIALIGAAIHAHRERDKGAARTLEIFLVWWMVVAVGIAAIFGSMFHLFDGPSTAREIGYSNGDGLAPLARPPQWTLVDVNTFIRIYV